MFLGFGLKNVKGMFEKENCSIFQNRKKENDRNMFDKTGKGKMTKTCFQKIS